MTRDISATSFFRQAGLDASGISFEHEEIDTGGTKRPTKIHLHAVDPDSGDRMGTLTYHVPRRKADKIFVEHLGTEEDHRGKGVASHLMDEMQRRHPGTPIDHGDRTPDGKSWWEKYSDGKKVTRGRTMASLTTTAAAPHEKSATYAENPLPAEVRQWRNTEWDVPHQVDEPIHRGLTIPLSPEDHALVHDPQVSPGKRASHIVKLVSKDGNLGRHWTLDPDVAHHYSTRAVGEMKDHPHVLAVSLHAHPPAAEHIEHDPVELGRMQVKAHSVEKEIPLKDNAPVRMYGVSWHNPRDQSQNGRYIATAQAKGITRNAFSTPVPDNHEPYQHEHPWLPRDHFFAPGEEGLDPRLFDENERMHPEVRQQILSLLHGFWAPRYGDGWQSWARVYLAGSEASHFYGNGDLDILIGVDYDRAREYAPSLTSLSDEEISTRLTDELRHGLNDDQRMLPGADGEETGPWENTWYVNPDSYDIRDIKPYAAYDITRDEWAVKPVEVPGDFGPEKLPEATWDIVDAVRALVKAVAELPPGPREREGAALYDYLHTDRSAAFGEEGTGLYDTANVVFKSLIEAPGHPLQQLVDWKRAHERGSHEGKTAA